MSEPTPPVRLTRDDLTGRFVQVRASLVRKLKGNAAAAIVLSAIELYTNWHGYHQDGHHWWRCSYEEIASETGLSTDQVRRAVRVLEKAGFIEPAQHALGNRGVYDRTRSYRIVLDDVSPGQLHVADSPDASGGYPQMHPAGSPDLHVADSPDVHVADSPHVPTHRREEGGEGRSAPAPSPGRRFPDQCSRHQQAENDEPCGACGKARRRHEERLAAEAAAAIEGQRQSQTARCPVDGHEHYPATNCPGCRADRLAAS